MPIYKFPENFKWGSATSAHQVEGGNYNDWSEWESSEARISSLKSRGFKPEDFISGKTCDSYNRYEEDFNIARSLNQNIHRFSIEWSRIEPEEGRFDEKEMQHYINVVKSLRERGIEPMITLWHFTNPVWFSNKGGFLNKKSPEYFKKFVSFVAANLRDQVGLWITFNEATTVYSAMAYYKGLWPPQHRSILEWSRCNNNVIRAHIEAYKEIKRIYDGNQDSPVRSNNKNSPNSPQPTSGDSFGGMSHNVEVGIAENNAFVVTGNKFHERLIGKIYNYYRNLNFFQKAFPYYDFIGLNYYHLDRRGRGSYGTVAKQDWQMESMGWEIYPKGIYSVLNQLKKFRKPIYITENGTADSTDSIRSKYIAEHLRWVWQAIQDGADIRGYLYWSLLDNFEWSHGFGPRFGLVQVDYDTLERHIRPSALEYGKICLTNQLEI